MRITEINPLSIICYPLALFALNHILKQVGLNPINYGDWAIWVLLISLKLASLKIKFN
jgi:hypothetical protein